MFKHFTERMRLVLALAREEAQRMGARSVEGDHLLAGIAREGRGLAASALLHSRVKLDQLVGRQSGPAVDVGQGVQACPVLPLGDSARAVLWWAHDWMQVCNHDAIATEHLLLGLCSEGGTAARALAALAAPPETLTDLSLDRRRKDRPAEGLAAARSLRSRAPQFPTQSHCIPPLGELD